MEMIIRLILNIFGAVFEKDVKYRALVSAEEQRRRQEAARRAGQKPVVRVPPPPGAVDPPHHNVGDPLSAWLEEYAAYQQAQAAGAAKPKVKPKRRPVPQEEPTETYAEHLAKSEARSHQLEDHLRDYLGVEDAAKRRKRPRLEALLGPDPLKKMVLADVILGPPAGKRRGRRFY